MNDPNRIKDVHRINVRPGGNKKVKKNNVVKTNVVGSSAPAQSVENILRTRGRAMCKKVKGGRGQFILPIRRETIVGEVPIEFKRKVKTNFNSQEGMRRFLGRITHAWFESFDPNLEQLLAALAKAKITNISHFGKTSFKNIEKNTGLPVRVLHYIRHGLDNLHAKLPNDAYIYFAKRKGTIELEYAKDYTKNLSKRFARSEPLNANKQQSKPAANPNRADTGEENETIQTKVIKRIEAPLSMSITFIEGGFQFSFKK